MNHGAARSLRWYRAATCALLLSHAALTHGQSVESPGEDFLNYLAEMEQSDDSWTDFDDSVDPSSDGESTTSTPVVADDPAVQVVPRSNAGPNATPTRSEADRHSSARSRS